MVFVCVCVCMLYTHPCEYERLSTCSLCLRLFYVMRSAETKAVAAVHARGTNPMTMMIIIMFFFLRKKNNQKKNKINKYQTGGGEGGENGSHV